MSDLADRLNVTLAGRYTIQRELGTGGMATVFLAEDLRHHRPVAIKVLNPDLATAIGPERFLREIEVAARLQHPHILPLLDSGDAADLLYYVMPYVEGESLRARLERERQLPVRDALRLAGEVASALDYAHRQGVIHRDIKPENILLADGQAVVADFGIARAIAAAGGEKLTGTGIAIGTPAYMSPEQAAGDRNVDARTDIYALGCFLYEMLAGQPPFTGPTAESLVHQHLNAAPRPVTDLRPAVPDEVVRAIQRALSKTAADRFGTAAEFAATIAVTDERWSPSETATTVPMPAHRRVRSRIAVAGAVGLVALAAFFGTARLLHWGIGTPARADENALAILAFENLHAPDDPERLGQIVQELAITDLSELGSLKVLSSQRLHDVERQVHRGRGGAGSKVLALRVASQAGARTLLTGTLSRLGVTWILTAQLVDVANGTVITSSRVNGDDLYSMIDDLTRGIRDDLRLRVADRGAVDLPVRQKTSPSIEAFRHYVAGSARLNAWDFRGAIVELRKAIAIDTTFDQAEYRLAIAQWWQLDDLGAAREPLSRLLARSPGASTKDRLMAEGALALVSQCFGLAERRFEEVTRQYTDEKEAWYGLGEAWYHGRGGIVQAREAFSRALALDPEFTLASMHLADIEQKEGRPDSARAMLDRLIATHRESPLLSAWRVVIDVRARDEKRIQESLAAALRRQPTHAARRDVCVAVAQERAFSNPDRAREVALRAHGFDPGKKDPAVYTALAQIARNQNQHVEAERWILRGLEFAPNDRRLVDALGRLYADLGRNAETIARARKAIQKDPAGARAWYWSWAGSAVASGDSAEASRAIPQALAIERDPYSRRDVETMLGYVAFQWASDYPRAEGLSRMALQEVPECESPEPYNILGWSLLPQLKLAEAEDAFRRGLALSPSQMGLQNGLLQTLGRAGKHREQLALARRIGRDTTIIDRTQGFQHWTEAAVLLDNAAELDSALSLGARSSDPSDARYWHLIAAGDAHGKIGNSNAAIRYLREAHAIRPDLPWAATGLGTSFEDAGRFAEAEQWLRTSLAINSTDTGTMDALVTVLLDQRRFEEAGPLAERCAALWPPLRYRPIEVKIRAGQSTEADALLSRALPQLQSNRLRRRLLTQVATVYVHRGDLGRARALAERAAAFGPREQAPLEERYLRGFLPLVEGRFAVAESAFAACRNAGADVHLAAFYVALARVLSGNHASAERQLRDLIERKPATYHYYSLLSALLSHRGRSAEAVPFAERAVAMDSSRTSLTLLAWALVSGGEVKQGEALARLALRAPGRPDNLMNRVYPFTPSLEQTLGVAAWKRGDHKQAVRYLEEAARLRADRPSIQRDLDDAKRAFAAAARPRAAR